MNRTATILSGIALTSIAVLAAPLAAQAAVVAPPAPSVTHTTISGFGHNRPGGIPVPIHGNTVTRHLSVAPGGVRTVEVNDYSCTTNTHGQFVCKAHVLETLKTDAHGNLTVTLPVHKHVHSYAIYVRPTAGASAAETAYWGVYRA